MAGPAENTEDGIKILNLGTKILLKDVMDQYIRTLGNFKTHYAPTMQSALRVLAEKKIDIIISEVDVEDGSAWSLRQTLGGDFAGPDLYLILAVESNDKGYIRLAEEVEAHSLLVKPIAATDVKAQLEKYLIWQKAKQEVWRSLLFDAIKQARARNFDQAETLFQQSIAASPKNPIPVYKLGISYLSKPDLENAEKYLATAIEMKPDYVQALSALGAIYLQMERLNLAEEFLERAHRFSPYNADRRIKFSLLYIERALAVARDVLRLHPNEASTRLMLGKLLAARADYPNAVHELEGSLKFLSDNMVRKNEIQTFLALSKKLMQMPSS